MERAEELLLMQVQCNIELHSSGEGEKRALVFMLRVGELSAHTDQMTC